MVVLTIYFDCSKAYVSENKCFSFLFQFQKNFLHNGTASLSWTAPS